MEFLVGFWVVCGIAGAIIGSSKNAGCGGFILGLLLGPIGLLAAFTLDNRQQCPQCKSRVDDGAVMCPQCHAAMDVSNRGRRVVSTKSVEESEEEEDQQVHFKCKACRTSLSWPAADAGNKILCTNCGEPATVPDFSGSAKTARNVITCPDCNGQVSRRLSQCPHCGSPIDG